MKEGIIYSSSDIEVCYNPDLRLVSILILGSKTKEIRFEGDLKFIHESKKSHTLIFHFLDIIPRVFVPQQKKLFKVRQPEGCIYLVQGKLLMNIHKSIPWVWIQKGNEYIRLKYCAYYPEPDSFDYKKKKDGTEYFIIDNERILIEPEDTINIYPEQPSDLQSADAANENPTSTKQDAPKPTPAKLQELAETKGLSIVKDVSENLWVIYSIKYSGFCVWEKKAGTMSLLIRYDGYSCGTCSATFLGDDVYFATLDSVGTIKIWQIDGYIIHRCQTLKTEKMYKQHCYRNIEYYTEDNKLLCKNNMYIDYYTVRVDTYKAKKKNNLLLFDRSLELPKITSEPKIQHIPPDKSLNRIDPNYELKNKPDQKKTQSRKSEPKNHDYTYSEISDLLQKEQASDKSQSSSLFIKKDITVYVGIDFGTSRTKICYQTARDKTPHVLYFHHIKNKSDYSGFETWSMPSIVVKKGNNLCFGIEALTQNDGSRHDRLKTSLLQKNCTNKDVFLAAAYIAYLFCTARDLIKREQAIKEKCRFVYSVCLPVEQMNNNKIVDRFNEVLILAEQLIDGNCYFDFERVEKKYQAIENSGIRKRRFSEIIPESAAEIADFHKRLSDPGIYALYDFGAGTTDLTIFQLNRNHMPGNSYMLGAKIVYKGFMDIEEEVNNSDLPDTIIRKYYKKIFDEFLYSNIWKKCKNKRTGLESMKPFYNMKILASGGASNSSIILDIFKKTPFTGTEQYTHPIQQLENPPNWILDAPYHRCAVAYGLSQTPEYIIKQYKLPKDCEPINYDLREKQVTEEEQIENNKKWI